MARSVLAALLMVAAASRLPAQADSATQAQGRKLFEGKGLCFSCHGKDGAGVLGPTTKLAGRSFTHTKPSAPAIATLIRSGVDSAMSTSGQVMPARGGSRLTDAEIDLVAAYVAELNRRSLIKP